MSTMLERHEIESFLVLAEELHFRRTAERLGVAQGRVSQTIKKMERRIGAPLFTRTTRQVALTDIGRQLHDDLRPAYDQMIAGLRRATTAAQGIRATLRVGFIGAAAGQLITRAAQIHGLRHPEIRIEVRELQVADYLRRLPAGDVDVAIVPLPYDEPGTRTGVVLFSEPRVLAVSSRHPLARRESVTSEDLAGLTMLQAGSGLPDYWRADRVPQRTPSGRPIRSGAGFETLHEALALIGAGEGVFILGDQLVRFYGRPDVAYVPLTDADPLCWVPAWRTGDTAPAIATFVGAAVAASA